MSLRGHSEEYERDGVMHPFNTHIDINLTMDFLEGVGLMELYKKYGHNITTSKYKINRLCNRVAPSDLKRSTPHMGHWIKHKDIILKRLGGGRIL